MVRRRRRAWLAVQLCGGVALIAGAVGVAVVDGTAPAENASQSPPRPTAVQLGPNSTNQTEPTAASFRLRIPTINVDAPIVGVEIDDQGVLGVPNDPDEVGWWASGPVPGSNRGTSIIAGHANTALRGPGALKTLETITAGDAIIVEGWGESITFEVESVEQHPRTSLPTTAFDQRIDGRLAIVSCSDLDAETGTYRDNLIVYARRVDRPAPTSGTEPNASAAASGR